MKNGFTLIELIIVVAIIGILTAVAYPAYQGYILESRRTDAKANLATLANGLERYRSTNNTYADLSNGGYPAPGDLDTIHYKYTIESADAFSFTVKAAPMGSQAGDACGELTIDNTGTGSPSGCW